MLYNYIQNRYYNNTRFNGFYGPGQVNLLLRVGKKHSYRICTRPDLEAMKHSIFSVDTKKKYGNRFPKTTENTRTFQNLKTPDHSGQLRPAHGSRRNETVCFSLGSVPTVPPSVRVGPVRS